MNTYTQRQVAKVFSRHDVVAYYDQLARLSGLTLAEQILIRTYLPAFERLLVVGCGTGREVFALAEQKGLIVGIDIAWAMVRRAYQKYRLLSKKHLSFQQGSVVYLPYQDASFDHALMFTEVIQHIPKRQRRQQALQELFRVLKPGGYVCLSAFNKPISVIYLLLVTQKVNQRVFPDLESLPVRSPDPQRTSWRFPIMESSHWWGRLIQRLIQRIRWELKPDIWSYADPLPLTYRIGFACACAWMNMKRSVSLKLRSHAENLLEPNDFLIEHPHVRFHLLPTKGELFVHFPDIREMFEDLEAAGFQLVEYRSLEELQQGQIFSEEERRSKRLIFYVAQKPG